MLIIEETIIVVEHLHKIQTSYCHLLMITVGVGQVVSAGSIFGDRAYIGNKGGAHLDFVLKSEIISFEPM